MKTFGTIMLLITAFIFGMGYSEYKMRWWATYSCAPTGERYDNRV
jgi:hypothetical protein